MQLGVIGLGTMGANLARNAARCGAKVAVYNRTTKKTAAFMKAYGSEGEFVACNSLPELCAALSPPRPILLMVKAGEAVDAVVAELEPLLTQGDVLVDGGNSHFRDTDRRTQELKEKGFEFLGMGVSGGEEGALHGPSMMPGGSEEAWHRLEPLFTQMAADDGEGGKCISYMGAGGAGHFVKMVHNGIEYALMQLIAESYDLLRSVASQSNAELAEIFALWNKGEDLQGFLMEITAKIFAHREEGIELIDLIKDSAGQKGTGKWTSEAAFELGVAVPTITAAVDARILSGSLQARAIAKQSPESIEQCAVNSKDLVDQARSALELSSICAFLQGFSLMQSASAQYKWDLPFEEIARIWRGGCIIRSTFLTLIQQVYATGDRTKVMQRFSGKKQREWRHTIALGTGRGVPLPAMSSALAWYDAARRDHLPQNLIQAQRDFFGAHTYERIDREGTFHTEWQ